MTIDAKHRTLEMLRVIRMDILTRARSGDLDYDRSIQTLHKHLTLAKGIHELRLVAQTYNALGVVEMGRGHLREAEVYIRQGIVEAAGHELGHTPALLYGNLGEIYRRQALYHEALDAYTLSQALFEPFKDTHNGWSTGENNRGWTYLALQEYETARTCFENVPNAILIDQDPAIPTLVETYAGLAEVALAARDYTAAWGHVNRAEEVAVSHGNYRQLDLVYATKAHIAGADGSQDPAALYAACRENLHQYSKPPAIARFIFNEALYQQRHNQQETMQRLGAEAYQRFMELGMSQEATLAARLMQPNER